MKRGERGGKNILGRGHDAARCGQGTAGGSVLEEQRGPGRHRRMGCWISSQAHKQWAAKSNVHFRKTREQNCLEEGRGWRHATSYQFKASPELSPLSIGPLSPMNSSLISQLWIQRLTSQSLKINGALEPKR